MIARRRLVNCCAVGRPLSALIPAQLRAVTGLTHVRGSLAFCGAISSLEAVTLPIQSSEAPGGAGAGADAMPVISKPVSDTPEAVGGA